MDFEETVCSTPDDQAKTPDPYWTKLLVYIAQYANQTFMAHNLKPILTNLEKADRDNCLDQFFLNKKPYKSAFAFAANGAVRGKDQVAIVLALHLYGADQPEFAKKLNTLMKRYAKGSSKEFQSLVVLMAAQLDLQAMNISLIDFVDEELLKLVHNRLKWEKPVKIILFFHLLGLTAFAAPLIVTLPLFFYCWLRLFFWIFMPIFSLKKYLPHVRTVQNRLSSEEMQSFREYFREHLSVLNEDPPAQESPAQESPAQESPAQESPAQESPAQESPAQESPAQESPAQEPREPAPVETVVEAPTTEPTPVEPAQSQPATTKRFCPYCGRRLQPQTAFCGYCGKKTQA